MASERTPSVNYGRLHAKRARAAALMQLVPDLIPPAGASRQVGDIDKFDSCDPDTSAKAGMGSSDRQTRRKLEGRGREERNAREKERSSRIAEQINDLRVLLSNGGVVIPKGSKQCILSESLKYIQFLQSQVYRGEM
jgi:Helix-loop-helix DNA-binding domain